MPLKNIFTVLKKDPGETLAGIVNDSIGFLLLFRIMGELLEESGKVSSGLHIKNNIFLVEFIN